MQNLQVKKNSFCGLKEFYITISEADQLKDGLATIIHKIKKRGLAIIKIIFIGEYNYAKKYTGILIQYPTLFLGDNSNIISDKKIRNWSVLIQAIKGIEKCQYIKKAGNVIGIKYQKGDTEFLSITGIDKLINKKVDFAGQADESYQYLESILRVNNFQLKDVYRFWNYMEDISVNYSKFNQVRNGYFEKNKLKEYPAATGIEAHLPRGAQISINLEAVEGQSEVIKKRIKSKMQCEAVKYGPKFSRATLITCLKGRMKKLYVSGTSSVDKRGKSILVSKPKENITYVINCVEHLLKKNQLSLNNIVTSHTYFKNNQMYQEFRRIYQENKWTFPYNPFFVEICRDNFFFEMECVAASRTEDAFSEIFG